MRVFVPDAELRSARNYIRWFAGGSKQTNGLLDVKLPLRKCQVQLQSPTAGFGSLFPVTNLDLLWLIN
jgi:hypothetical protein